MKDQTWTRVQEVKPKWPPFLQVPMRYLKCGWAWFMRPLRREMQLLFRMSSPWQRVIQMTLKTILISQLTLMHSFKLWRNELRQSSRTLFLRLKILCILINTRWLPWSITITKTTVSTSTCSNVTSKWMRRVTWSASTAKKLPISLALRISRKKALLIQWVHSREEMSSTMLRINKIP